MADTTYTDDLDLEAESKKRLSDVTNRLNKSRADLAFSMSNEGKEIQIQLKQQQDLLKAATGRLGVEERISASASEIKSIEEEIKLIASYGKKTIAVCINSDNKDLDTQTLADQLDLPVVNPIFESVSPIIEVIQKTILQ